MVRSLAPSDAAWHGAAVALYVLGTVLTGLLFTTYFLQDFTWQKLPAYVVWVGLSILVGVAALLVAALIMWIPTVYRLALAVFAPIVVMSVFPGSELSSALAGVALILVFSCIGAAIAVLRADGFHPARQRVTISVLALGVAGFVLGAYAIFSDIEPANPLVEAYVADDRTLDLPNPATPGDFHVATLTYGSGKDRHRKEFGDEVDVVARSVDGTRFIDNWEGVSGWLRTSYWGFGVSELPLQGRVWLPDGDGPFPLVLIVHGNHSMEDFSDPGYGYLGKLLASRGIILASVDENFINYAISAGVDIMADRPGLKEENDARGWLLLEHLAQWRDWNDEPGHQFQNKVDMERVALIGHSRGGEAVGIAAAFNSLDRYPDDATVEFNFNFNLRGVIAIAPVYGQYEPRDRPTPVRDVNYFTIHGSMDGDVQSFEGIAQYSRVSFSGDAYRFRAGLYVVGANHGQFNTTWENMDTGLFRAWSLDLGRIMDAEAQRDVARVYFSAFLEVVLNGRDEYLPIFKDARYAASWLPKTFFINRFSDTTEAVIADFEEDIDPATMPGGRITATGLSKWYEVGNSLKDDRLDSHSLIVAWDYDFSDETAWVAFSRQVPFTGDSLTASISAIDIATMPDDWQGNEEPDIGATEDSNDAESAGKTLDWSIELRDAKGNSSTLPLSHDSFLFPLIKALPARAGFLDDTEPTEVLFRRFELPMADFVAANPEFDASLISQVRFVFDRSKKGAIMVDNISVSRVN
jgi:hypothetical protein